MKHKIKHFTRINPQHTSKMPTDNAKPGIMSRIGSQIYKDMNPMGKKVVDTVSRIIKK